MRRAGFKRTERKARREAIHFLFLGLRKWFYLCVLSALRVKNFLGRTYFQRRERNGRRELFTSSFFGFEKMFFSAFPANSALKISWDAPVSHCDTTEKSLGRAEFKCRERKGRRETMICLLLSLRKWFFLCVPSELCVKKFWDAPVSHCDTAFSHLCVLCAFVVKNPGTRLMSQYVTDKKSLGRNTQARLPECRQILWDALVSQCDTQNFFTFPLSLFSLSRFWDAPVLMISYSHRALFVLKFQLS